MIPHYSWNQDNLPPNKYRYRLNWRNKLILEIGVASKLYGAMDESYVDSYKWHWRDATIEDLQEVE